MKEAGMSSSLIAERCGISHRTVNRIWKRMQEEGLERAARPRPRSGRPTIITLRVVAALRRYINLHPFDAAFEIRQRCPAVRHLSARRINEALSKHCKRPSFVAAKKPLLTDAMIAKRLAFCNQFLHWTPAQWMGVMFSDESRFAVFRNRIRRVRRPIGKEYRLKRKFCNPTVKHPVSVMVWGAFTGARGRAGLFFLPANVTMNQHRYLACLDEHLIDFYQRHQATHFLHDGAPCHRARAVTDYLHLEGIRTIPWPGNSPDLNPIENAWAIMKTKLANERPTSRADMIAKIKRIWCLLMTPEYFRALAESMPRRLAAVIANGGFTTKY